MIELMSFSWINLFVYLVSNSQYKYHDFYFRNLMYNRKQYIERSIGINT